MRKHTYIIEATYRVGTSKVKVTRKETFDLNALSSSDALVKASHVTDITNHRVYGKAQSLSVIGRR